MDGLRRIPKTLRFMMRSFGESRNLECSLLAHSRHSIDASQCPLSGVKRELVAMSAYGAGDEKTSFSCYLEETRDDGISC